MPTIRLVPRNADGVLRVLAIGRTSSVHHSDESIDAYHRCVQEYLARIYQGPLNLVFLDEQASGRNATRATIVVAERRIATCRIDLVIAADLSRIVRDRRLQDSFLQQAINAGTRVVCLDDDFDNSNQQWK